MRKRWLALWLVFCIVFLSMPVDGLCAIINANTIVGPERATAGEVVADGIAYMINSDGETLTVSGVSDNSIAELSIPETVSVNDMAYRVTAVKYQAFYNNKILKKVIFPSTVTAINYKAFEGCENLSEVILPSSLETLGYHAFKGCNSLTKITVPKTLTAVDGLTNASPFYGCANLTEVTLEEGLTKVPAYLFKNIKTVTSIRIPDGVTEIGTEAFYGCEALEEVVLPEGLLQINESAFLGCIALGEIELPSSITMISSRVFENCEALSLEALPSSLETMGYHAFKNCTSLTKIKIPKTLASIGGVTSDQSPFVGCSNLSEITFENGITEIPANLFYNFSSLEKIVIPDGVTEIGAETFKNCTALKEVVLPEGLETINTEAFYGCIALEELYIPHTVTEIGADILEGAVNVTVCANKDSHATVYAIDHEIPFRWVGNTLEDTENSWLDRSLCQYITEEQSSANGYISYQIDYGFKPSAEFAGLKISVYIPDNVTLVESTIIEDGVLCTDYLKNGNVLTIPVAKSSGRIKYKVKQENQESCYSYATILYNSYNTEVIGATKADLLDLSLLMDEETSDEKFGISGVALPGKEVSVYLDNELNGTVTASKTGVYQADLTISEPKNYKTYDVKVKSLDKAGEGISVDRKITYIPGVPKLETFIMQHNGQRYSLTEFEGLKPIVTFRGGCEFRFEADFTNTEQIEAVYFVSTRNNIEKKMKAVQNESTGVYEATGYFDESNKNYVPGTITIEYIKAGQTSYFEREIDFTADEYVNSLPEELTSAKTEIVSNTEEEVQAVITFPELDNAQIEFSVTSEDIPEELTEETAEEYGYQKLSEDEMAAFGQEKTVSAISIFYREIEDEVTGELKSQILDFADGKIKTVSGYSSAVSIFQGYNEISEWMEMGVDYKNNRLKINEAREAVNTSDWSAEKKAQALDDLETARILNNKKVALKVAATILAVAGIANPTLSLMIGAMSFMTDVRLEATMLDVESLVSKISGSAQISFRWAIDPSGYIYDADSLERISGATVTLYYKETESSSPVQWDASEYLQLNPLISAEDGTYAWDVPEGLWQVKAEKEGYETVSSEWLPVPPPQTEVNLALKKIDEGNSGGESDSIPAPEEPPTVTPENPSDKPSVTPIVKVSNIKITGISKKIAAGKKVKLEASVSPSNASNKAVRWTTSNQKYATVSSAGVVSLKKAAAGKTVTITATANDGSGIKATYKIKVMKHAVKSVKLKASKKTVKAGKSVKVKATVKTTGKKVNKTLKWSSSNTKYATVSSKGVVKTKKAGKGKTVTITAMSTDGTNKKAKIKIKIK